jgi:hypothetical protein
MASTRNSPARQSRFSMRNAILEVEIKLVRRSVRLPRWLILDSPFAMD